MSEKQASTIAVIMPIYNSGDYLRESLDSIVAQTCGSQRLTVICVDDGSTDENTLNIMDEYDGAHENICVLHRKNGGYGTALNQGLDYVFENLSPDYIGFLEPDDFAASDTFEVMMGIADEYGCDIVKSNYYDHCEGKEDRLEEFLAGREYGRVYDPREEQSVVLTRPCIWSAIYRSSLLKENCIRLNETPGASFQDTAFAFMCYASAESIVFVQEGYIRYRIDNAASSTKSTEKVYSVFDEMSAMETFVNAKSWRKEVFGPALAYKEFWLFEWNERRLGGVDAAAHTQAYIAAKMARAQAEGMLDRRFFDEREWERACSFARAGESLPNAEAMVLQAVEQTEARVRQEFLDSASFRVGHAILEPVRPLKHLLRK